MAGCLHLMARYLQQRAAEPFRWRAQQERPRMYLIPSPRFLAQLKNFEGFKPLPYVCPAGRATIGYGTNLEAHPEIIPCADIRDRVRRGELCGKALVSALKKRGMHWTGSEAESAMISEVLDIRDELEARCTAYTSLVARDECVRAEALLDMAYNMGVGRQPHGGSKGCGLLGFYAFLPRMECGDFEAAANGLVRTAWYRQVGRRARMIAQQIRTGRYNDALV